MASQNVVNALNAKKYVKNTNIKRYGKLQAGLGNSSKGHAFSEFRKLKAIHEFKKFKRKERKSSEIVNKVCGDLGLTGQMKRRGSLKGKSKYQSAREKYEKETQKKEQLKKEREEYKRKRDEDLKTRVKKRQENNKKLNKRTKRGQPIMANHIEYMLEKIQT